jgi:nitrogen fixation NifU-like protein
MPIYSKEIIKHFKNPRNVGKIKNPSGVGEAGNLICVLPETPIHLNNEIREIKILKKGQRVFSHDGRYHQINAIFKRRFNGTVFAIKNKFGENFITPDHLVLGIKFPKNWRFSYTKNRQKFVKAPYWCHAIELQKRDMVAYPIIKEVKDIKKISVKIEKFKYDFKSQDIPKILKIDNGFLRLAGYYLAEGGIEDRITSVTLNFAFNLNEKEYARDVFNLVKKIFKLKPRFYEAKKRNTLYVYIPSVAIVRLFKKLFGKGAENKHLPHWMTLLPPKKQKNLILGMWRGDGYFDTKRIWPRAGYSTISYQLAQQLKILLLRQRIIPSIYEEKEKIKNGVKHQKSYRIHIGERSSLEKLADILGIILKINKEKRIHSWIKNGYVFLPIADIRKIQYRGEVYNLGVEKSNSFVSDSISLHNCGDVMKLYLKIGENRKREKIIDDVKFETLGCVVAVANTSLLTTLVKGKKIEEALKIKKEDLIKKLGQPLPLFKIHCSVLAVDALKEAIYDYYLKEKIEIPADLEKEHQRIIKTKEELEKRYKGFQAFEKEILE